MGLVGKILRKHKTFNIFILLAGKQSERLYCILHKEECKYMFAQLVNCIPVVQHTIGLL